ncbi:MAG: NAD(P)H-dependent oxidoreductase subunit E [Puniceicoccales bacterium]|jgi:NADH:ubiquinone oxidoreductase subunit E|nr:NAD(P)H-dependent oxidoreductase subunit E [Puniceicoccales bacterium]
MKQSISAVGSSEEAKEKVRKYVDKFAGEEGNLIMILHAMQSDEGYIPRELALELSLALNISVAQIYEVLTFYHFFKLTPQGKHNVVVCLGTACYLKGAADILKSVEENLGIKAGETTADRLFHIEVARCIGACGIAPAVKIDGEVIGKATSEKIVEQLNQIKAAEGGNGN